MPCWHTLPLSRAFRTCQMPVHQPVPVPRHNLASVLLPLLLLCSASPVPFHVCCNPSLVVASLLGKEGGLAKWCYTVTTRFFPLRFFPPEIKSGNNHPPSLCGMWVIVSFAQHLVGSPSTHRASPVDQSKLDQVVALEGVPSAEQHRPGHGLERNGAHHVGCRIVCPSVLAEVPLGLWA